jgi:flagellar protein FlaG
MSSNSITSVQVPEITRLQGTQPAVRAPQLEQSEGLERNESAAGDGQGVPLSRAADVEQVQKLESAISQISDFVQNFQRDLQFSIDKESERLVVKVVDSETQEVIRQIPSEETLRIIEHLDSPESLILREQA